MSAPIFRDPEFDGATDPTLVHDPGSGRWWLLYTQRRATVVEPGVAWVHGSRIGRAVSTDAGSSWHAADVLDNPAPPGAGPGPHTEWAPEVVWHADRFHQFLTFIRGVPDRWDGHPRSIEHLESVDGVSWRHVGTVRLGSDRVIDAALARTADGRFRLWAKDESAGSTTVAAVSDDLHDWRVEGIAVPGRPHEGPNVFELGGWWWMLVDEWRGLRVLRSADGVAWERGGLVLDRPGRHPLDRQVGRHADVVVQDGHAIVVYFTHPHWNGSETGESDAAAVDEHRSAVHVARATVVADRLVVDRDIAPELALAPPPPL